MKDTSLSNRLPLLFFSSSTSGSTKICNYNFTSILKLQCVRAQWLVCWTINLEVRVSNPCHGKMLLWFLVKVTRKQMWFIIKVINDFSLYSPLPLSRHIRQAPYKFSERINIHEKVQLKLTKSFILCLEQQNMTQPKIHINDKLNLCLLQPRGRISALCVQTCEMSAMRLQSISTVMSYPYLYFQLDASQRARFTW